MSEAVSVRFRGGSKNYDFDPRDFRINIGDELIVQTSQGVEYGICTKGRHEDGRSVALSPVLRHADENDKRVMRRNKAKEREAFDIGEQKIAEHELDMKLIAVYASFDGNKMTFYFTSDDRVDFRSLVRDMAAILHCRIELRQIGVRDEARMTGGIGICGRPFCCAQFLTGFLPVSIKMAKTQNLSLNPSKISGACGRLMCCLKYEQNAYEDAARRLPKLESFVQTPDGPGNVKNIDLLRETIKVSLDADPEHLKTYRRSEIIILRNGKGGRDGIELPERPARYVEKSKKEEPFPSAFEPYGDWDDFNNNDYDETMENADSRNDGDFDLNNLNQEDTRPDDDFYNAGYDEKSEKSAGDMNKPRKGKENRKAARRGYDAGRAGDARQPAGPKQKRDYYDGQKRRNKPWFRTNRRKQRDHNGGRDK